MARGEIAPGIMEDCVLTHMTSSLARCTYYTPDTTPGVSVSLDCSQSLGKRLQEKSHLFTGAHTGSRPRLCVLAPGDSKCRRAAAAWASAVGGGPRAAAGLLPPVRGSAPGWGPLPSPPAPAHTPGRWRLWRSGEGPQSPGTAGKETSAHEA